MLTQRRCTVVFNHWPRGLRPGGQGRPWHGCQNWNSGILLREGCECIWRERWGSWVSASWRCGLIRCGSRRLFRCCRGQRLLWRAPAAHASINPLSKQHPALTQSATALPLLLPHYCSAASSDCQSWRKQGACSGGAEASGTVAGACRSTQTTIPFSDRVTSIPLSVRARASPLLLPAFQGCVNLIITSSFQSRTRLRHALECLRRTRESPESGAGAGPAPAWFRRMTRS